MESDVEMKKRHAAAPKDARSARQSSGMTLIWCGLLLAWFLVLCFVPTPSPLGAPEFAVKGAKLLLGVSEPVARAFATIILRGTGLAVLGVLLVQSLGRARRKLVVFAALVLAPLLAVLAQWINYAYFPIAQQAWFGVVSAVIGVLIGFSLRHNRVAMAALAVLTVGLFVWGTSTNIDDDLYRAARMTGLHILETADEIPEGDAGFAKLMEEAFAFAGDNSLGRSPVLPNRAAILALSVILGEGKVATVAMREVNLASLSQAKKLRRRITLYGRRDLSRHFWVSAGLTVLANDAKSMTVGIEKELMDATPGGSGFSFVDLTADRAGTLFAVAATRNEASARAMQARIQKSVVITDFIPNPLDLPEKISGDDFQAKYGGLGGKRTEEIAAEIRRRLAACEGLR